MNRKIKRKGARKRLYKIYQEAEEFISALDNDLRAEIFEFLQKKDGDEFTQKQLVKRFKRSQPTISESLRILCEVGAIVKVGSRKKAKYSAANVDNQFYSLASIAEVGIVSAYDQVDFD